MPTTPDPFPAAAAASNPRCTAADVKADRRSPAGPGLETGEDQRTLTKAEATPAASPDHRHNAAIRTVVSMTMLFRILRTGRLMPQSWISR